jgi:hypothetical protein
MGLAKITSILHWWLFLSAANAFILFLYTAGGGHLINLQMSVTDFHHVVQATSAEFGLLADKKKFSTQNRA